jgi:outer membrane receptor for ferrienterochelin and colicin
VFDQEKGTSIGLIVSGSYHDQDAVYGRRFYDGSQGNLYVNAIFQTNFTEEHKLVAGASVNFDIYKERLETVNDAWMNNTTMNFDRQEVTPGVFAEYSFSYGEKLSLLAGIRGDWSSRYGLFATPRFNVRYSPWQWWNIRGSVGLGYRSPNLLSDNAFVMPTSRKIVIKNDDGTLNGDVNTLKQERALNAGISTTFYIPIDGRELQLSAEYYYTNFFENVVADMDTDPHAIIFSNLSGKRSYAGNAQIEATMEVLRGWTMTLAYRMTDVKTTINDKIVEKPLTNRFKGLITTSYVTPLKRWQFDLTAQFNGGGRMPNPDEADPMWDNEFTWYPQLMAQITKYFRTWSIYLGAENITNFKQKNPVIDSTNPFSQNFDASMAWGPIHGAKVYVGFRWALNRK